MSSRERRVDVADQATGRQLLALGAEIREARIATGLSQAKAGSLCGMSQSQASRIERGKLTDVSVTALARLMAIVGLDLSIKAYPGGPAVRDEAQLKLLERLRSRLDPALKWRTEVPLPIPGDRRAWDATITGADVIVGVDAESKLRDVQAVERRMALKQRDGGVDHCLLLLGDTHANRATVNTHLTSLRIAFPIPPRAMLAALAAGRDPGGSGLILL